MRSDLECSSPAFDKHEHCKNTKGTNPSDYVSILSMLSEISADCMFVEHSMYNLVSEMRNNFIVGMLHWISNMLNTLKIWDSQQIIPQN